MTFLHTIHERTAAWLPGACGGGRAPRLAALFVAGRRRGRPRCRVLGGEQGRLPVGGPARPLLRLAARVPDQGVGFCPTHLLQRRKVLRPAGGHL